MAASVNPAGAATEKCVLRFSGGMTAFFRGGEIHNGKHSARRLNSVAFNEIMCSYDEISRQ